MAKQKKRYSVRKVKGTPHHELVIDEDIQFKGRRKKYLFSSPAAAKNYFINVVEVLIKNSAKQ